MNQEQSQYNFESTDLMLYLWKRRIPLLIITLLAAIISTIVSFTITPKFRSTVVLFPASETPVSKSLLQANFQDRVGILGFGDELQLERLLQVLHSDQIRDRIIDKFNLMDHYEIPPDGSFPLTKLYAKYKSNVEIKRTQYNSIVVEVMDTDPKMAAEIANEIAALIDTTMNQMRMERAKEALRLVEEKYLELENEVNFYKDTLAALSQAGLIYYEAQTERLTEAYAKAKAEGNISGAKRLSEDFKVLEDYSGTFLYYHSMLTHESLRLSDLKAKYMEARAEAELLLSNVYILDKAYQAEKKAYPRKSIIVMVSTLATFILAVISYLFFESFLRKLRSA